MIPLPRKEQGAAKVRISAKMRMSGPVAVAVAVLSHCHRYSSSFELAPFKQSRLFMFSL